MTDRLHSCKDSPTGRHAIDPLTKGCRFCHRTVGYLADIGWNAPALDPDAHLGSTEAPWKDEEADVNDTLSSMWGV